MMRRKEYRSICARLIQRLRGARHAGIPVVGLNRRAPTVALDCDDDQLRAPSAPGYLVRARKTRWLSIIRRSAMFRNFGRLTRGELSDANRCDSNVNEFRKPGQHTSATIQ